MKIEGIVLNIIDKSTVMVGIVESKIHPLYKKVIHSKKKIMCGYGSDISLQEGCKVCIAECKPISKRKRHCVISAIV